MRHNLSGKNVLVTGASRGIGRAVAELFAADGANVAALATSEASGAAVAEACRAKGVKAIPVGADVADEAQVDAAVEATIRGLGSIDILINNAGVGRYAPATELTAEDWDWMLAVNVKGVALMSKAVARHMTARRQGHIVTISSVMSSTFLEKYAAYCASKAAVDAFTEVLAKELLPYDVRVSLVRPGGTRTGFAGISPEDKNPGFLDPMDVAEVVRFVADVGPGACLRHATVVPPL